MESLPELVSKAIEMAIETGKPLNWKVQGKEHETLVQLVWQENKGQQVRSEPVSQLPELVTRAIQVSSGINWSLAWKVQYSQQACLVELVWSNCKCMSPGEKFRVGFNWNANDQRKRSRNTPSRRRRNARRLQAFLQKKQTSVEGTDETVPPKSSPMRPDEGKCTDCDHSTPDESTENLSATSPIESDTGTLTQQVGGVLDLSTCDDVRYVAQDGIPGVCYSRGGKEDWTPVKKKQEKTHQSASVNADTIKFPYRSKDIRYVAKDGVPGISYRCGNTRHNYTWIQIEPSPIALRTRARTNLTNPAN